MKWVVSLLFEYIKIVPIVNQRGIQLRHLRVAIDSQTRQLLNRPRQIPHRRRNVPHFPNAHSPDRTMNEYSRNKKDGEESHAERGPNEVAFPGRMSGGVGWRFGVREEHRRLGRKKVGKKEVKIRSTMR